MLSGVDELSRLEGVKGVALVSNEGRCVAHQLTPPYRPVLIAEATSRLRPIMAQLGSRAGLASPRQLFVEADQLSLFLFPIQEHHLAVLCAPEAKLPELSVACNALAIELARNELEGDGFDEFPAEVTQPGAAFDSSGASAAAQANSAAIPGSVSSPEPPVTGADLNGFRMEATTQVSERPRSRISTASKVMNHIVRVYKRYVGERAEGILEREVSKLGCDAASLSAVEFADLIHAAASEISDDQRRQQFWEEVLGDRS